jgi:hypothetical protein
MPNDCGTTCPVDGGFYSRGSLSIAGNAILLAVFAVLTPAVLYTGVRFRTPLLSTILATGLVLEVVGFVGRILLHGESNDEIFFLLSLLGTVIGPAFITGALISILPHILSVYGEHLSPFRPILGGLLPGSLQVVAVIVQVVGVVIMALDLTSLGVSFIFYLCCVPGVLTTDIAEGGLACLDSRARNPDSFVSKLHRRPLFVYARPEDQNRRFGPEASGGLPVHQVQEISSWYVIPGFVIL